MFRKRRGESRRRCVVILIGFLMTVVLVLLLFGLAVARHSEARKDETV